MGMTYREEQDRTVCRFEGDMDTIACTEIDAEFSSLLDACLEQGRSLELDMSEVNYIASSFLRLCGKACQRLGQACFSIAHVTPPVKKVFKIAGVADALNVR